MLDIERRYSFAFWTLNVAGWMLFQWLDAHWDESSLVATPRGLMWHVSMMVTGLLVTIPLRYLYRSAFRRYQALRHIIPLILVACFVSTNLWNVTKVVIYVPFNVFNNGPSEIWEYFFSAEQYLYHVYRSMWVFLLWSIIYFAWKISIEWWQQRTRMEEAAVLAQNAKLMMLRYQMNPHFLFNSLNTIRSMVNEDPAAARAMISDLAGFLRYSLVRRDQRDVPLHDEIAAIRKYLTIEKRRFESNLDVAIDLTSEANDVMIPCFIVQPLVENAVKHGRRTSRLPLRLRINCTNNEDGLIVRVANTGKLRYDHEGERSGTGTGLENVKKQLQNAYPGRHRFTLCEQNGWVTAQIEIFGAPREQT
jgi:hypothetical protein